MCGSDRARVSETTLAIHSHGCVIQLYGTAVGLTPILVIRDGCGCLWAGPIDSIRLDRIFPDLSDECSVLI